MIAFHSGDKEQGQAIGQAMRRAFAARRVTAQIMQVAPDNLGTQVDEN
jgi:hypothetical protein